jgi:aspartyl-tRNA(Asn)/glutamyl-tRNA(Gln) amidotransferase subunit A
MEVLRDVFTVYWDLPGHPVLAVPIGFTSDVLPLSMQIASRPFDEATVLRIGDAYQQVTDWHLQVPPLAGGLDPELTRP